MPLGYDLGVHGYRFAIRFASPFKKKAKDWIDGRKGIWDRLKRADLSGCIWMHCASVGEFEQGLPILEKLRSEFPEQKILLTFYSPSGYNAKKDHVLPSHIDYLPLDTPANAKRFLSLVQPSLAVFVKYEFWYHFLAGCQQNDIPVYLASGIFRKEQAFFKWYGRTPRKMLHFFDRLFVQNEASKKLLNEIGIEKVEVSGDTRFDRVAAIASAQNELPIASDLHTANDRITLVAGSTWPSDEKHILSALADIQEPIQMMIAPHELGDKRLRELEASLPEPKGRWSDPQVAVSTLNNLLVDEMGVLSRLYRYSDIAYVGGGFETGIHNTLEPAAHGKPVLFGPNHARFAEAQGLIDAGAAWCVSNASELTAILRRMTSDPELTKKSGANAARYVEDNKGATERIVAAIRLRLNKN